MSNEQFTCSGMCTRCTPSRCRRQTCSDSGRQCRHHLRPTQDPRSRVGRRWRRVVDRHGRAIATLICVWTRTDGYRWNGQWFPSKCACVCSLCADTQRGVVSAGGVRAVNSRPPRVQTPHTRKGERLTCSRALRLWQTLPHPYMHATVSKRAHRIHLLVDARHTDC